MAQSKLYRSFLIAGFAGSVLLTAACSDSGKSHKTMSEEQHSRWAMAKIGVMYQLAQQQYAVGEFDKCRLTVGEALAAKEPHAGLQMLAGKVEIEKGALEAAAEHLKESIHIDPTNPEPYYLLGVVFQRWQKMDVAADYYQQAWDRKAGEPLYLLAVVEMRITQGQLAEAEQLLNDKIMYFEQSAAVRVALAKIAILKGEFVVASKHYREAYLLSPEDENVKRSYAESLFFAGKFAEAATLLDDIRAHMKPAETGNAEAAERVSANRMSLTLMMGQSYLNTHRLLDARTCFQEVAREHPENLQATLGLGKVYVEQNELNAALAAGRKVLRSDGRNVQAMILVAMVQQKQGKWAEALTTLEGASAVQGKDSTVLCMQGVSVLKLGRRDEAVGYFEKALAANPKDQWAADLLGRTRPVAIVPVAEQSDAPGAAVTTALPRPTPVSETP